MQLYDNAFSPFARKVRMVLDYKGLEYETLDGLDLANHDRLVAVNGRVEVPVLVDGELVVVNSADIVASVEHAYPEHAVYPAEPAIRARARAWERCADDTIDPILVNISYWHFMDRPDTIPAGLLKAARSDLGQVYDALERDLAHGDFVCGAFSIADIALFPHLVAVNALDIAFDKARHERLAGWLKRMREMAICRDDVTRARAFVADLAGAGIELKKIFWRGDRIEWMLARGYHKWFVGEIEAGRVIWPGLGVPT